MPRALAALAWGLASALALATPVARGEAAALDAFPGAAGAYLVRVGGATLWAGNPDRTLAPASLTKLMTALLALEAGGGGDATVISGRAAKATGTRLGLAAGMRVRRADLVAAALIASANDACLALAEATAGNEAAFVARMNRRAGEMGLAHTHFVNACGHDAPGHLSSARDLAALGEAALQNAALAELVGRRDGSFSTADGRVFRFATTNALLGRVPGVRGVKTGYTKAAGHCLIAVAERDGVRVLVVMLGARDRWWDAAAMIENAFRSAPR